MKQHTQGKQVYKTGKAFFYFDIFYSEILTFDSWDERWKGIEKNTDYVHFHPPICRSRNIEIEKKVKNIVK